MQPRLLTCSPLVSSNKLSGTAQEVEYEEANSKLKVMTLHNNRIRCPAASAIHGQSHAMVLQWLVAALNRWCGHYSSRQFCYTKTDSGTPSSCYKSGSGVVSGTLPPSYFWHLRSHHASTTNCTDSGGKGHTRRRRRGGDLCNIDGLANTSTLRYLSVSSNDFSGTVSPTSSSASCFPDIHCYSCLRKSATTLKLKPYNSTGCGFLVLCQLVWETSKIWQFSVPWGDHPDNCNQ